MTSFNMRPDDVGIRNLKNSNSKPATAQEVDQVPGYPQVHPIKSGEGSALQRRPSITAEEPNAERMDNETEPATDKDERREKRRDRRKQQLPVILDTRSGRERRQIDPDADNTNSTDGSQPVGVDLYI